MFDTYSEIFAERGAAYHRAMAECPNAREAEFLAVLDPLAGRSGLLCDMPSGGAYLAGHVSPSWRYVGVDPSDEFVRACPAGVECLQASITEAPIVNGTVDAVVSLAALHHEPDLAAVFREMRRLLRAGGRAVVCDVAAGTAVSGFLNGFDVIALDGSIAESAVRLRQEHRIKLPDAIIWASAEVHAMLLVTRNTKDFPAGDPGTRIPYRR